MQPYEQPEERKPRKRLVRWLVGIAIFLVASPFLFKLLFSIKSIEVQGNRQVAAEEVVATSGIQIGDSIFSVSASKVRDHINSNRYLEFVGLWRSYFPSSVIITVTEHTPRAKMAWMGMLIIVGESGMVLEQTAQIDTQVHVPEIIGMTANQVRIGQPLTFGVAGQGEAIEAVLDQLDLQGIGAAIAEINIASPDSMFLVTEEGMQIAIGNDDNLAEKFALIREVLPRIETMGTTKGGMLDVTTAKAADYSAPK